MRLLFLLCVLAINPSLSLRGEQSLPAAARNETDGQVSFFQWKVRQDPEDFFNYDHLGLAYIHKARETGDVTYYDLASQALKKSLELESDTPAAASATKHLSTVYFSEHRFAESLALAQKALTLNPRDITAYASIGDAFLELGDYQAAWENYSHLQPADGSNASDTGVQYLRESRLSSQHLLEGRFNEAIASMNRAIQVASDAHMPREAIAWSQFMLGDEYFQYGRLEDANTAFQASLSTYPGYHRALYGLARVAAAQDHLQQSAGLLEQALAVIPYPAYAAALGDIYTRLGDSSQARKQYALVEYIARLGALSQSLYNRELAVFYADHDMHVTEALQLARREFELRHDIYTWDTLAWTLFKASQPAEAAEAIQKALQLGTRDPLLLFHAGMIYDRLNQRDQAAGYLRQSLELNPAFHPVFASAARQTLTRLQCTPPAAACSGATHATR